MNKLFLLLKNYFNIFSGNFGKKKNKKSYLAGGALLFIIALIFVFMFGSMTASIIIELRTQKEDPIYALYSLMIISVLFVMMMIVLKGNNNKKVNDYDFLMSLPIKKETIVLSKILKDFLFDFLTIGFTMLPGIVVYWYMCQRNDFRIVLFGVVICILLTLLSNALSILIRSIISKFTRNLKSADVIQTIINVIFCLGFIGFYYYVTYKMDDLSSGFMNKLYNSYPIKLLIDIIYKYDLKQLLILFCICIIPFIISTFVYTLSFDKQNKVYKSNSKTLSFEKNSVFKDLLRKELGTYFRSTNYVVNTCIGAFLSILLAVLFSGEKGQSRLITIFSEFLHMTPNTDTLSAICIIIISITCGTVCTTACSISLEGKHFWILKAYPINPKTILLAKGALNMLIGGIPSIIASIVVCVSYGVDIYMIPIYILMPILFVFFASVTGLSCNLKWYRFDWTEETEVIKQGMSLIISLALNILPGIIAFGIYLSLCKVTTSTIIILIPFVLMIIVDLISFIRIKKNGPKLFENIY